ncbi:MAG TPA: serine/threonine-protein kinase [Micromonosporaceae bacterium]|nr:serine/threonine-protein kinase [Micromonosporaceae bacterium]
MTASATGTRPPQIPGYQYVADIATGGYSVVYRYRQRSPRRDVAVKVLTEFEAPVSPTQRDAEADMMAKLGNHPNIVQVIVADVAPDGRHYIIMPYYPGRSLAELLREGQLAVGKVLRVGVQIAGALDAAHRLGLLHRDIKPANILIDEYGTPRLTDFGIAGWVGPDQRADTGGMSLPWSPAEVVAGGESSRASDVYSLGATLFHLLAGQPPYARPSDTRAALEQRIQTSDAPPTGRPDVPASIEKLLARMLSRSPRRRPESASLVAAELRDIEADLGGPSPADAPWHSGSDASALPERFVQTELRDRPFLSPARASAAGGLPAIAGGAAVTDATVVRPPTGWPDTTTPRRRRTAQWVLTAAATVAVGVVAAGIALSAHGAPAPRPTPTPAGSQNALVDDQPPGAVTVAAHRTGSEITFTWTYDGALASDTYLWRIAGSDKTTASRKPTAVVPDQPGNQLCIQVKVVRADGNGSTDWSPAGCGS